MPTPIEFGGSNRARRPPTGTVCSLQRRSSPQSKLLLTFFGQHLLGTFQILQQPIACEAKEIKSEFRILKIKLADLVITDREHTTAFDAFNGLGSAQVRRQQTHLAENMTW